MLGKYAIQSDQSEVDARLAREMRRQNSADIRFDEQTGQLDYFSYQTFGGTAKETATMSGGTSSQHRPGSLKIRSAVPRSASSDRPTVLKSFASSSATQDSVNRTREDNEKILQSLFGDHQSSAQSSRDSAERVSEILKKPVLPKAEDLIADPSAEAAKRQLEWQALVLDEQEALDSARLGIRLRENNEDLVDTALTDDEKSRLFFDSLASDKNLSAKDRAKKVDEFVGKAPNPLKRDKRKDTEATPPDMVILPVYGQLKEYCQMLQLSPEAIEACLRSYGIYECEWILQETGEIICKELRPNTGIALEQWTPELKPMLATSDRSEQWFQKKGEDSDDGDNGQYEFIDPVTGKELNPSEPETFQRVHVPDVKSRIPVICVLGHVDHGKTTLLDYLRDTHIVDKEAGHITQSIGAFNVKIPQINENGDKVERKFEQMLFFDTPGHAAFSGMRERGAHAVDVGVLVISATEGIQPQTRECLAILKKERLPFIIALNKCDRNEADPERVIAELRYYGITEKTNEIVRISARYGKGIDSLLETLDLICELEEPMADYNAPAELIVMESTKSRKDGCAVTCLVRNGTLFNNDFILPVCESLSQLSSSTVKLENKSNRMVEWRKVTRLMNEQHQSVDCSHPSTAVTFLAGYKESADLPSVGTVLMSLRNKEHALSVIEMRKRHIYFKQKMEITARMKRLQNKHGVPSSIMNDSMDHERGGEDYLSVIDPENEELSVKSRWETMDDPGIVNIWIKADNWGSVEAIEKFLFEIDIPGDQYSFNVVQKDTGDVNEQFVRECDRNNRNCFILAFNVGCNIGSEGGDILTGADSASLSKRGSKKTGKHGQLGGSNHPKASVKKTLSNRSGYKPKHVEIIKDDVIFHLFEKFVRSLENRLDPIENHVFCGRASVEKIFSVKKNSQSTQKMNLMRKGSDDSSSELSTNVQTSVAGIVVSFGKLLANGHFRVKRDERVIYEQLGATDLRHFAITVMSIEGGDECGLQLEFDEWQRGDVVECFEVTMEKNKIDLPMFELSEDLERCLFEMTHPQSSSSSASASQNDLSFHEFDSDIHHSLTSESPRVHLSRKTGATRVG